MTLRLKKGSVFSLLTVDAMSEEASEELEGAMRVINLAYYSSFTRLGEVDLSSFTYEHAERALNEMFFYESDDYGEDEGINYSSPITLLNRHAHFKSILKKAKPHNQRKKRLI
ncbi:hypothetical protein [Brevibacillus choshinensis]|uniref:hypothetical protein n=1 Tax=Brevibacillus choshinensis TaxID=54911 RepID=UPI002E1D8450|nr:hypothetical protein [Brevibacillus choshinensis]